MVAENCLDIILFVLSVVFFVFGIFVWHYDRAAVALHRDLARSLKDATTYGPTVLPIMLAAVLGRASRYCLSWRLEQGEALGVLDLLASSTTVTSVLLSQLVLRKIVLGAHRRYERTFGLRSRLRLDFESGRDGSMMTRSVKRDANADVRRRGLFAREEASRELTRGVLCHQIALRCHPYRRS